MKHLMGLMKHLMGLMKHLMGLMKHLMVKYLLQKGKTSLKVVLIMITIDFSH